MYIDRLIYLSTTGRLNHVTTRISPGPRERLLAAAQDLTYAQGMAVGVDALLKAANVARRSLYEHFGGKDGLITELLRRTTDADEAWYRDTMQAAGDDPHERVLAVFDALATVVDTPDFRGCRYLAADLALADPDHPAHQVTSDYRERLQRLFHAELVALDHPRPDDAAAQLVLVIDGLLAAGATRPDKHPAALARGLAEQILGR
jgi:AcrR family transcriptional regulator